ncbi:MAG: efflux RND transporter permease subunit [Halioglobus sp.]
MNFTDIFIRRPVLATVLSLVLFVLGFKALQDLQIRQYPKLETGVLTITTIYPGASASNVQGYVTQPIQQQVASTEGIDYMYAQNEMGKSTIRLYLKLDYPTDSALAEVLALVQQVKYRLPDGTQDPSITKSSSQPPVAYISFTSAQLETQQTSDFVSRVAVPLFSTVAGVNRVDIEGERDFAMRLWLNPKQMAALSIDARDIQSAISANNAVSASGRFKGSFVEIDINARTDLQTVEQFENIAIKDVDGRLVRIKDIATVELGANNYDEEVSAGGKESVMVAISNTADSNPLDVIDGIYSVLPEVQAAAPPGMAVTMVYDSTRYISTSIEEVTRTLIEAILIVIVVVFMFLGSFRSVLIPVITIPLSLIGTLFVMLALGFSINLLTLLALVLAISLVVDDAIVVVENTSRHLEEGMDPMQAAIVSAREIASPVISMTITLAAVYAPIGFMGGLTGSLFTEFAFTLAGAVLISGFIALTLSPMMCSRILSIEVTNSPLAKRIDSVLERLRKAYEGIIVVLLANRTFVWPLAATVLTALIFMLMNTAQELAPEEDQGAVLVMGTGPTQANTDYLRATAKPLESMFGELKETDTSFSVYGYQNDYTLFSIGILTDWGSRERTAQDIQHEMQTRLQRSPGLQLYTFSPPVLPGTPQGLPYQLVVKSAIDDLETMYAHVEKLTEAAADSGKFIFIKNDLKIDRPQIDISIDRDKASSLGISAKDIGRVLQGFLSEGFINYFSLDGRSYQVISEVPRSDRLDTAALGTYFIRSASGEMVPLSAVVNVEYVVRPSQNNQFQQLNSATIEGKMMPGVSLSEAHEYMIGQAEKILPKSYLLDSSGELRQFLQEGSSLVSTFFLAIIIIYLVLAAQFESFRDPLVILTTVPLSIFGAMLPLYFGAATLNIYTEVGLVTLIGLISKHGILIVQFANDLQRDEGLNRHDAILKSAGIRLRPVLMTTAAMVIGVLPLVTASGAGAESRFSIGLVISVGMAVGTLFTLFVLPAIYTFLAEQHNVIEDAENSEPTPKLESASSQ